MGHYLCTVTLGLLTASRGFPVSSFTAGRTHSTLPTLTYISLPEYFAFKQPALGQLNCRLLILMTMMSIGHYCIVTLDLQAALPGCARLTVAC